MLWRGDDFNIAYSFYGCKGGDFNGASEKHIHEAIEWLKGQKILPAK
jgi:hypothetical protein